MKRPLLILLLSSLNGAIAHSQPVQSSLTASHRVARVFEEKTRVSSGRPPVEVALTANGYSWARLILEAPASSPPEFAVVVTDRSGVLVLRIPPGTFEVRADGSLFHVSEQLRVDFGRVTVAGDGATVTITQVVRGTATVSVETRVGDLNLTAIDRELPAISDSARAVVLLEYSDGDIRRCNAFLVAPDIIVTNNHCIGRQAVVDAPYYARIYPDFTSETRPGVLTRVTTLLHTDPNLDISLLKLKTPLPAHSANVVAVRLHDPGSNSRLRLVQFYEPLGWQKVVSADFDCRVRAIPTDGNDGVTLSDFFHGCDTEKGSSGTAVFDTAGRFVGLHRVGRNPGHWPDNKAVSTSRVAQLIATLQKADPATYGSISIVP